MISSPDRTIVLSSLGWVERDALWVFDARANTCETVPLDSGARYVSLHATDADRFSVHHHHDGKRFEVTVRLFSAPTEVIARAWVEEARQGLWGDAAAWTDVPRLYVDYLAFAPWKDSVLIRVLPSANEVEVQRLEWYDERYDKDYQGIVEALELPGESVALVSVQRSSTLVLHDLQTGTAKRSVGLRDRGGNPGLKLSKSGEEIWASDYDTLVVLERADWRVARSARLESAWTGTQRFIGDFSFAPDAELCAVARPFSGDVVGLDTAALKTTCAVRLGQQPFDVAALTGGEVVARDWKTGAFSRGRFAPIRSRRTE
jgi:hypothetical protein